MTVIYNAATTINGFLADDEDSLQWLFDVSGAADTADDINHFLADIDVLVMGSTTYEWLLRELESPIHLTENYAKRPIWVFSSRDLPVYEGTTVRIINGPVSDLLPHIDGLRTWVMGGGDLAGQFLDAGALDQIIMTVAPVFLPSGRPSFPRRLTSDQLSLTGVRQLGQFVELDYGVSPKVN